MNETAEKLKLELSQLSAKERAEIAYFLIEEVIWVIAIAHGKRKPNYWKQRNIEI